MRYAHARSPGPLLGALACLLFALGCEEEKPTKLELRPGGDLEFRDLGTVQVIKLAFFTSDGKPFVRRPDAVFDAEDPSVVTVTAAADNTSAKLQAKKSGETTVSVRAFGLEQKFKVRSQILGSVELAPTPKTLKVNGKPVQLQWTVKDDRGNVIEGAKVQLETTDYCVDVSPTGEVKPVSIGVCDVIVDAGGKSARATFDVR